MNRSGAADLPLHYGYVPTWLAERMAKLGLAITEALIMDYGKAAVIRRLSDPFWFQSLGAVMGMDWHSSGVTTSVMGALKRAINPHSRDLGIYICGGKGKFSRQAPEEIPGADFDLPAELVIKALGFDPEDLPNAFAAPELKISRWGTLTTDFKTLETSVPGVFAAGDIVRGASLVVWAIRDGRDAAEAMHRSMSADTGALIAAE